MSQKIQDYGAYRAHARLTDDHPPTLQATGAAPPVRPRKANTYQQYDRHPGLEATKSAAFPPVSGRPRGASCATSPPGLRGNRSALCSKVSLPLWVPGWSSRGHLCNVPTYGSTESRCPGYRTVQRPHQPMSRFRRPDFPPPVAGRQSTCQRPLLGFRCPKSAPLWTTGAAFPPIDGQVSSARICTYSDQQRPRLTRVLSASPP